MQVSEKDLEVRLLTEDAIVSSFCCGRPRYDDYIKKEAKEDQKSRVGQVWLFFHKGVLAGYVSIAMSQLHKNDHKKLGGMSGHGYIPGLLLGQMARDKKYKGNGLGAIMINWVIREAVNYSKNMGCRLVIVQSEDDKVQTYQDSGFILVPPSKKKKNIMFFDLMPYFT